MAVQVTVFVPNVKTDPLGGSQTTSAPQLSVTVVANSTNRSHRPEAVLVTIFVEHTMTGFSRSWTVTVKLQVTRLLLASTERLSLTARSYDRVRKVARTIADLAGADRIAADHVAEALQFRVEG